MKTHKLTPKERLDQESMIYFYPKSGGHVRVYPNDRLKMAQLSSRGIKPKNRTKGFLKLLWGKTYRDLQITQWKDDIRDGLITKAEIVDSMPPRLREWTWQKIKDVPYDEDGLTTAMFISWHRAGREELGI